MSSCGHSSTFSFLPPTIDFLTENFPNLVPDQDIDRSLLRCRLCDLIDTQAQADIAAATPPGQEPIEDIETEIILVKDLLASGKSKEDLTNVLPDLKKRLASAISDTDTRIEGVWKAYWAVWGPGEGPDPQDEPVEDDLQHSDFAIEIPPEEKKVETKKVEPKKVISKRASRTTKKKKTAPSDTRGGAV